MKEYMIIIEKSKNGYSAYSPDIDGCVAVGDTKEECENNMREALHFHIEMMLEDGLEVPKPIKRTVEFIHVNTRRKARKDIVLA